MCKDISDIVSRWLALELSSNGYYTNPNILQSSFNQIGTWLPRRPITKRTYTVTWQSNRNRTSRRPITNRRTSSETSFMAWSCHTMNIFRESSLVTNDRGWSFDDVTNDRRLIVFMGMITWWGWVRSLSSSGWPSWLVSCPPSSFSWKTEGRCYFKTGGRF